MDKDFLKAVPAIIGIILAIICIAKIGFNIWGGVFAFIAFYFPCGIANEIDKNKAASYLAEKYDEEHKKK
ncbi:hypothetical protein [Clostridium akagii]|uniref:hypothetical protein n=1 Tax=Clostridium akagii TaxID=91623 RepID=UPI00047CEF84|nr:hypothetical protein [Clostridium akagii]